MDFRSLMTRVARTLAFAALFSTFAKADDGAEFFEKKIRPILVERCQRCHDSTKKQSGGLALDTRAAWQKGGDSGPAIHPGDPDGSLFIQAVRWKNEDLRMPPEKAGGKLSDDQIADLEAWVKRGAADPRTDSPAAAKSTSWAETFEARRAWWSLQPVGSPAIPEGNPSATTIDRFLDARMLEKGVAPIGSANPRTLIRRAALVLNGLPPTAEEASAFEEAAKSDPAGAYAALVDRLLASPRFGERFARHWLDVVRFSETHGNEWNYDVPFAWRYRDYVIRAFNDDLPYNQFVREHIAGDLMTHPRWNREGKFNESLIGTAFYRFGEVNHDSCVEFAVIGYDIVDNQLDTLTKAFQATTVACARCHDHKQDAVSTRDYYSLLGILRSTRSVMHTLDAPEVNREPIAELKRIKGEIHKELASAWRDEVKTINADTLKTAITPPKDAAPSVTSPSHAWLTITKNADDAKFGEAWKDLTAKQSLEETARSDFNSKQFQPIADFRKPIEPGWTTTGMGLRDGTSASGDFAVAAEGDSAIKSILSAGLFTFGVSDKLNGALRSPTLERKGAKISFEVIGGGSSLSRLVNNNCQLNYTHQQSLHYNKWTWVTIKFDDQPADLHPYAEFLTYWDSPKYPDPLGTLGKDTTNQRNPFDFYVKNPRTWWGVRRIVAHNGAETPREDVSHLARLFDAPAPKDRNELAAHYAQIAARAVDAFAEHRANDDDVKWIEWLLDSKLISNKANLTPRLAELIAGYRKIETNDIALPRTMPGMADEGNGFAQPVFVRGDYTKPSEKVERKYIDAIAADSSSTPLEGSGRGALADAIASPKNPLTARVMVNRVWQWVFGKGLARTPDDFGHLGDPPSHPELLDHLTTRFMNEGWSVKKLTREIVLTQAFQRRAAPTKEARERDPDNVMLSHYPARRAEAEVIRDALLAVSGRLDGKLYGTSVHPYREKEDTEKRLYAGPLDGDGRRSLYIKFQLMESPRFLSAFNLPGGKVVQGRRDTSNVPAQSLALMNDPFVLAMSDHWAKRLVNDGSPTVSARIDRMFQEALGRPATSREADRLSAAVHSFAKMQSVADNDLLRSLPVWKDASHAIFNFKEFIFIP